jgi:hypothetical protein
MHLRTKNVACTGVELCFDSSSYFLFWFVSGTVLWYNSGHDKISPVAASDAVMRGKTACSFCKIDSVEK